jgi:hypothetical protein
MLFLALQRDWIIIRLPSFKKELTQQHNAEKKSVKLFFWKHDRWTQEGVEVIWVDNDMGQTTKYLIDRWLTWLDEERLTERKVSLQSVMITPNNQEAMLSFDRSPFPTEWTTYEQWMWIESLLKTVRDNNIRIQRIRFLVHHQELIDYHLDFNNPWPIIGFVGR